MRATVAALLFLACAAAHGQMYKCADERGKLSYQEQPCAGTKSLPPPRTATSPAAPAPAAPKTATPPAGGAPAVPSAAGASDRTCAENWPPLKSRIESIRQTATKMRDQASRDGVKQVEALHSADFLRECTRHGFAAPETDERMRHNDMLAKEIIASYTPAPGRSR